MMQSMLVFMLLFGLIFSQSFLQFQLFHQPLLNAVLSTLHWLTISFRTTSQLFRTIFNPICNFEWLNEVHRFIDVFS